MTRRSAIPGWATVLVIAASQFVGCERESASPSPPMKPPVATQINITEQDTPALFELGQCYSTLSMDEWMCFGHVYPTRAALELDETAAPDEKARLIELLQSKQDLVNRVISLSRRSFEDFPPFPGLDEVSTDRHLHHPRTWVAALARRLLAADASRAWEAGDVDGAIVRIAAMLRLGAETIDNGEVVDDIVGGGIGSQAAAKLANMVEAGPVDGVSRGAAGELRAALVRYDASDPAGVIAGWRADARQSAAFCREQYATKGGPAKYGEYLRQWGVFESATDADSGVLEGIGTLPTKEFADQAARLTVRRVNDAITAAESLIDPIAEKLAADDLEGLRPLMEKVRSDPTQIARVMLGGATLHLNSVRSMRESFARGLAAAERLPKN